MLPRTTIKRWTDADRDKLRDMRERNVPWKDCASHFGVSVAACHRQLMPLSEQYERQRSLKTSNVQYRPLEDIADKVVRPGIDKHLVPLCLYMGTRSFGRIHRWWNFSLAAMEQGCDDLTDIVKLSHHPDYSHLCGPETKVCRLSTQGFFTRLRDNPGVTDNIPGMTEWATHVMPRPFSFHRVPLESFEKGCAPWRVFRINKKAKAPGNVRPTAAQACYPYIAHDPKKDGFDLVSKVNKAVPRGIPDDLRADICQDIICAVLMGDLDADSLNGGTIKDFVNAGRKMFADKWNFMSLDAEIPGMSGVTYIDRLSGDIGGEMELA